MTALNSELLHEILSQPTAPFREGKVLEILKKELDQQKIPYLQDPVGNLVLGVTSQAQYKKLIQKKSEEPVRIFIAHTDHPGFHGVKWKSENELEVKWYGGSPTQHLEGASVWLSSKKQWISAGTLKDVEMLASGRAIDTATVQVSQEIRAEKPDAPEIFGGFKFRAPYWEENNTIYTKAADDLIGVFAIVSLAAQLFKSKKKSEIPFLGLLTRAEEVGFIGAIGHFELGWLEKARRPIIGVSLETSRALPGAEIGKGPVVRLGDKYSIFDSACLRVFEDLAKQILPEQHQKKVMDGGTCEATAATVYGFPCVGISVPLGNYHNQSFEGGPDAAPPNGPAPEFVNLHDVSGMIQLCQGLMKPKLPWSNPWGAKKKEFRKALKNYQPLLRSGP